jgi:hypothetical protein
VDYFFDLHQISSIKTVDKKSDFEPLSFSMKGNFYYICIPQKNWVELFAFEKKLPAKQAFL